jgi:hypothetical protein
MPHDRVRINRVTATVVASCEYADEPSPVYTVLLLMPTPSFYAVALITDAGEVTVVEAAENIVPAVRLYQDWGGDY